jgi:hypothetical protein
MGRQTAKPRDWATYHARCDAVQRYVLDNAEADYCLDSALRALEEGSEGNPPVPVLMWLRRRRIDWSRNRASRTTSLDGLMEGNESRDRYFPRMHRANAYPNAEISHLANSDPEDACVARDQDLLFLAHVQDKIEQHFLQRARGDAWRIAEGIARGYDTGDLAALLGRPRQSIDRIWAKLARILGPELAGSVKSA